uniref:Tyrosine-protein phosphatase domain-containing protein n=1 Tax=Strongyloides papillosus TaxID=174720 RepID=A0A0N5BPU2_STREA
MFLKLYWLGATLAMMPFLIQLEGLHRKDLFPNVPETINKTTFPLGLEVITDSDVVMVKCPDYKYKHNVSGYEIAPNLDIFKEEEIFRDPNNLFAWVPLLRQPTNQTKINCGNVQIKTGEDSIILKQWIFNVKWDDSAIDEIPVGTTIMDDSIPKTHVHCSSESEDVLIVSKNKEDNKAVKIDPKDIKSPYANQMFYYFKKSSENNKDSIKKPCFIYKGVKGCPIFNLPDYSEYSSIGEVKKIDINGLEGQKKKIRINLKKGNDEKFYRYEEISLSRMRYMKNSTEVIKGSTITITSSFVINGFDLVKLVYNCWTAQGNKTVSQTYYFGPGPINYTLDKTEEISANDTSIKVKCDTTYLNVGYLKEVEYNGTHANVNDLESTDSLRGKFSKGENSISFVESNNGTTVISCIYKTLDGSITTTTKFVNKDTIALNAQRLADQILNNITSQHNKTKMLELATMEKTFVKQIDKIKEESEENQKSALQKFSDKVGKTKAISLIVGVILLILIILAVPVVILYKKWLNPFLIMLKHKRKYPNVYVFWDNLTNESFDNYCKIIKDKKYLSDKVLNRKVIQKVEGGEEVDIGISHLFDETLVDCYKNLFRKIQAHYIYTDAEKRKYILSDGPTKDNQSSFWQMIYEEDIATIITIIYDKNSGDNDEVLKDLYWKKDKTTYKDIVVTCLDVIKVNVLSVSGYKIMLERKGSESKYLDIFHVSNWKGNEIPQSDLQFVNIYKEIIKNAPKKNILIHSTQGTGARVYMLTYFACIYDALISDRDIDCPMTVIKSIRDRRYGGNLVPYEFAYMIKALVTAFFNNRILIDFSQRRTDFTSSYDSYFYDYLKRRDKMDEVLKKFLEFVNIVDEGKMYEYKSVFYTLGRMDQNALPFYCKRYYDAIDNYLTGKDKKRYRYSDIQCLDANGITVNGKPAWDTESFIHANKFEYTTKNKITRKLILCQAPLDETIDDMLDMILRYKITLVVILVKPEEATGERKKWLPYFPEKDQSFETKNFRVSKLNFKGLDKDFTTETECNLKNKKDNSEMKFTLLHYQGWPDKSVPSEHMSIYSLYKRIISLRTGDYIGIHCSAGIGRTGTLALIMYLIDTINVFPTFDPIARLKCLREHRYLAVQKYSQFVFALMVVFEHYKKQINDMDAEAYEKFMTMAEKLVKKEKEIEDKNKK